MKEQFKHAPLRTVRDKKTFDQTSKSPVRSYIENTINDLTSSYGPEMSLYEATDIPRDLPSAGHPYTHFQRFGVTTANSEERTSRMRVRNNLALPSARQRFMEIKTPEERCSPRDRTFLHNTNIS